jgi:hypothetical protein
MKYTMSDGRAFTSYISVCQLNQDLQKKYGTNGIHEYRHYLQTHAEKVMADTTINMQKCTSCPICAKAVAYKPNGKINQQ